MEHRIDPIRPDLTTDYLGLALRSPLIVSACPLSARIENIQKMEDFGAAAIVLLSLFGEQFSPAGHQAGHSNGRTSASDLHAYNLGISGYFKHLAAARKSTRIPIISSMNATLDA